MAITRYSQLQYTSAATKEQINSVAKRLNTGLAVMRQFTIEETGITRLPRDLQVIGYIHGENPETGREWQAEYEAMQKTSNLRKLSVK